jgi:hypothetical protein
VGLWLSIAFGSACGELQSSQTRYNRAVKTRGLVSDFHTQKDIFILTREKWEKDLRVPFPLNSTALREEIRLHHAF